MTPTTLVIGASAAEREAAVAAAIDPAISAALIVEGIASGGNKLESIEAMPEIRITRIAPGCMCCIGNLTLKVTLNRILRQPPQRLFIVLANSDHIAQIRTFLGSAPYDALLMLTDEIRCEATAEVTTKGRFQHTTSCQ